MNILMNFNLQSAPLILLAIFLYAWTVFWKGVALWRSAQSKQKTWFIALLIITPINLLGIPELIFLFAFAKNKLTLEEIKSWFSK
ncbi:hypothetical protein C4559_03265 [Candidatus Microgenomates bacterium]|nr:MAG: hypothetical protein C4559_03265 [Candidatus Microgenomates bacterium]